MNDEKFEEDVQRRELSLRELTINMERLEHEYAKLLGEHGITYEQLKNYINNQENFSPAVWQVIQAEKKKLSLKLDLALQGVKEPLKVKKTLNEQGSIQSHWLFVR